MVFLAGMILAYSINPCGIDHIEITNDLRSYKENLDPEFCENLVEKIDAFNSQCTPYVEIPDCG